MAPQHTHTHTIIKLHSVIHIHKYCTYSLQQNIVYNNDSLHIVASLLYISAVINMWAFFDYSFECAQQSDWMVILFGLVICLPSSICSHCLSTAKIQWVYLTLHSLHGHSISHIQYMRTLSLYMAWGDRYLVLSSSECSPWPGLKPVDSAQEIRLDHSPRLWFKYTFVGFNRSTNTITQYQKQIEWWLNWV